MTILKLFNVYLTKEGTCVEKQKSLPIGPSWCKSSPSPFGHRQIHMHWHLQKQLEGHQGPNLYRSKVGEEKSKRTLIYAKTGNSKRRGTPKKNTFSWEAKEGLVLSAESYEKSYENTFSSCPGGLEDGWKLLNAQYLWINQCFNTYKY